MSVVFAGDTEWEEQPDWSLTVDDYGVDTLSRPYSGNAELLADFLKQYPKGSRDPVYDQLKRTGYSASGHRSFPTVTLQYKGIFADDLPDVKRGGGWRRQTATLTMQDDSTDAARADSATTCTIAYYAPVTRFRYVTRKQPTKQKYAGQLLQTDAAWEIVEIIGAGLTQFYEARPPLWVAGIVTGGTIRPGHFNYVRAVGTTIFNIEEAGDYWEVTEENEGRIEMVERADLPRLLSSSDVADAYEPEEEAEA